MTKDVGFGLSTLVRTPYGLRPIYSIKVGDFVSINKKDSYEVLSKSLSYNRLYQVIVGKEKIFISANQLIRLRDPFELTEFKDINKSISSRRIYNSFRNRTFRKTKVSIEDFSCSLSVEGENLFQVSECLITVKGVLL